MLLMASSHSKKGYHCAFHSFHELEMNPAPLRLITQIGRSMMSSSTPSFPVTSSIRQKLTDSLKPIHLDVLNESHMHNVPKNSETHFKVVVVAEEFALSTAY
jgi:hypothetical protein